ncbi:MAG: alpha/beta hydrolase [Actinomycetota bacterium]|nr:alpha/beta hydrolase [Actinomycetota bacterium]
MKRAALSDVALPPLDVTRPPWPGEPVMLDGTATYLRSTPGAPGAEPALYIHGLGGSSTNWTDLAALLRSRLAGEALDLPGFGHSDPAPRGGYTLPALSRRVARLIEHSDRGPVHLFGNSLGGAIAVHLAATRPELVRTLILISPAMPNLRPSRGSDPLLPLLLVPGVSTVAERRLAKLSPRRRAEAVIALCFADPSVVPENRLAEAAAEVERRNAVPWAMDAFVRTLRALIGSYLAPGPRSLWRAAGRVSAPTLIVWGRQDKLVDVSLAGRLAGTMPDSRLLILDSVGHTAQLESPVQVARAVLALLAETCDEAGSPEGKPASPGPASP